MESLTETLSKLECPMKWSLEEAINAKTLGPKQSGRLQAKEKIKWKVKEKLRCDTKYALVDGSAAWQKCCQFLTLAWLNYSTESLAEMREILDEMDDFMSDVGSEIELILDHISGFKYLANAMWAHLAYKEDNKAEVEDNLRFLKSFDDLEATDRAAVLALKCCVLMEFGPTGHEKAQDAINLALKLEENEAQWHFLKGKYMSQTRRSHNHISVPSDEELLHLRKAVSLRAGSAAHYVFCGQSALEFGRYSRCSAEIRNAHLDECEEMMTLAALTNDSSPIILTRIAKALMNMNGRSSELLDLCVHRSLELFPESGLVNHVAGNYYTRMKPDSGKAIFHLKKAALEYEVFGAFVNLVDVVWTTRTETELDPILHQFWEKYRDDPINRSKAVPIMAEFYFFVKGDVVRAIPFQTEYMISCKDQVTPAGLFSGTRDLTVPMVGEIQFRLKDDSNLNSDDEEVMKGFLRDVAEARPRMDLRFITRTRSEAIRRALDKMKPEVREVVAPKLKVPLGSKRSANRPPVQAQSWRAQQPTKGRQLPDNWRSS